MFLSDLSISKTDDWMDDLRMCVVFNCISVIPEWWAGDMKGCVQKKLVYDWKDLRLRRRSNTGPLDQQASA